VRISAEVLLIVLALALYVYDASLLLASNEAVLLRGWRGRWHASFGAHRWKLVGREPYVPNPFTPHRPLFRLRWAFDALAETRASNAATGLLHVPAEIAKLGAFTLNAALCLFVLLPFGLFSNWGVVAVLAALVLLYVNNLVALTLVFRWRARLHLTGKQFAGLAFECLVCPPFSVNLVRRLCARVPVSETFTAAAARLLRPVAEEPDAHLELNAQCLARIDEQLEATAEGSPQMLALQAARARYTEKEAS
jgi:hypothetical protein